MPSFALLAMLGAVVLWSAAVPFTKLAVAEIAAVEFVVLRLGLAALCLWLMVWASRADARPRRVGWRPFVMGCLEPGLVSFLVALGLTLTSPINGSVFWSLSPIIMPLLGRLVLGERIEGVVLLAALIAFAGTVLLAWGQAGHGGGNLLGDLLLAAGVTASAVNSLIARRTAQAGANPLVTSSWQVTAACGVTLLLLFVLPPGGHVTAASRGAVGALLFLGLVVSSGVFILSNYALRHLPVARWSLLGSLVAPVGAAISALVLGTQVTLLDAFAIALVMAAVALPYAADRRRQALSLP